MAPFRFKLEQVRLYRKQLEEQAMQALAQANLRRNTIQLRIDELHDAVIEQRTRLCRAESMTSGERWLAQSYATALKAELKQAYQDLDNAEAEVDRCRADLIQKAKERGLLDSLKEKQADKHLLMERQQEQRTNDETATLRYKPAAI